MDWYAGGDVVRAMGFEVGAQSFRAQAQRLPVRIQKNGNGSQVGNGVGRGREGQSLRQDQIARADVQEAKRRLQPAGSVDDGHRMGRPGAGFRHAFKAIDVLPDAGNEGGIDAVAQVFLFFANEHRRVQGDERIRFVVQAADEIGDSLHVASGHML